MESITLKVLPLIRLMAAAGTDPHRVYLHCVRVEPCSNGAVMVATNGHILAAYYNEGEGVQIDKARSLTLAAITQIKKALLPAKAAIGRHDPENLVATITESQFTLLDLVSGRKFIQFFAANPFMGAEFSFPDWRRVIPRLDAQKHAGTRDAFNLELFSALAETLPKGGRCAAIYQESLGSPAIVCGAPGWLGVIMPMRIDPAANNPAPIWFFDNQEALRAAA